MLLKSNIEKDIKNIIKAKNNILTGTSELYCYSEDASNLNLTHSCPDVVVFVESIEDVRQILKYANAHKIPIIARGAGTNMVGACTCPKGGIVINFSKMNKILDFNSINMTMRVQPGVVLDDIKQLAEQKGLYYPPDPSNYKVSTIGGSIAQSSGGAAAFKYGTTKDYILNLTVVLADGTIMKLGANTIKDAVGYHLNQLIVGSEGTLAIVVEAELKLIPKPEVRRSILAYFNSIEATVDAVNNIIKNKIFPVTIDFMDKNSINTVEQYYPCGLHKDKEALLLIDIDGFEISMDHQQNLVVASLKESGASYIQTAKTYDEIDKIWTARRASFAATTKLAPDVLSDDLIVPRSNIAQMVRGCKDICNKYNLQVCMVGHLGDGNIHPQIALNLDNEDEFKRYYMAKSEIYNLAIKLEGTISGEHGVGIEKVPYIGNIIDSSTIDYMKEIKKIFDPNNILNPGKIFNN